MLPTELPLLPLAIQAVRRADGMGATPVLAMDRSLGLTDLFMAALVEALHHAARREVRLEILLRAEGVWGFWRVRQADRLASRFARAIPADLRPLVTVERRSVLSRAAGPARPLVVGIAGMEDPLPEWASRLCVTARPAHLDDFQLLPAA